MALLPPKLIVFNGDAKLNNQLEVLNNCKKSSTNVKQQKTYNLISVC